jgi:predicted MPP superfamily phosphohydrolase
MAKMMSRRKFITGAGALFGASLAAAGYARFIEPRWLSLDWRDIFIIGKAALASGGGDKKNAAPASGATRRFRALHISDIHESDLVPVSFIEKGFAAGLASEPEVVFLTGDFITDALYNPRAYRRALKTLAASAPAFACLGNHDGGWRWAKYRDSRVMSDFLGDAGITVLNDETATLSLGGGTIAVRGLSDLWVGERNGALAQNIAAAFAADAANADARIVLGHNPDLKDAVAGFDWDILLAGHTHGGQVRYPPFFNTPHGSVRDRRFLRGLHEWQGRQLYVNQGLGNIYGVRFACRPQVAILDFHF